VINGDLSKIHEIDLRNPDEIQEFVSHSWYKYADESKGLHPWDGVTEANYHPEGPNFKGTRTKIEALDESAKYSWIKAPRWKGNAMEVGPLSRMVLGYLQPKQYPIIKDTIDGVLKKLDLPVTALFSTLGRTAARGIEALYCADLQVQQFDKLMANLKAGDTSTANVEKWEPSTWPKEAKGVGFTEAPRGALGHWIKIKDTRIDNYQCVVPTTWNGSPRDAKGQIGAFEASLMNTPMAKADQPLEILRTLHSLISSCSTRDVIRRAEMFVTALTHGRRLLARSEVDIASPRQARCTSTCRCVPTGSACLHHRCPLPAGSSPALATVGEASDNLQWDISACTLRPGISSPSDCWCIVYVETAIMRRAFRLPVTDGNGGPACSGNTRYCIWTPSTSTSSQSISICSCSGHRWAAPS
jgi:hypothetical protein